MLRNDHRKSFESSHGFFAGQGFKFHCPIRSKTTICIEIKRKPDPVINQLILDVWAKLRCLKRKYVRFFFIFIEVHFCLHVEPYAKSSVRCVNKQ